MEKEVRFRILNKTSKTVTVKIGKEAMTFPWEEFNKKLVVVDKFWAVLNEEEKKRQEQADDLVNDAVVCVMLQRGNAEPVRKLAALAQLGSITKKLQELLECSNAEVLNIIRQRLMLLNPWMVNPMFDEHEEESKEDFEEECEKHENPSAHEIPSNKPTFGDAFSVLGELKKNLEG